MSRSYRKPYAAVTGTVSAKDDKIRAARGVRHVQNCYLRKILHGDLLDQFLIPHRLECPLERSLQLDEGRQAAPPISHASSRLFGRYCAGLSLPIDIG